MTASLYAPTDEQRKIIHHAGPAFVTACPGAGKTRTMVERARQLLDRHADRRGVAFLSFTNAAVSELEARLVAFGVLPSPLFPSFIGTFDRFLWQFLISPFGIQGCDVIPRLVPDKGNWEVKPYDAAHPLPLRVFDRDTGILDAALAKKERFDVESRSIKPYETTALSIIKKAKTLGHVDFEDVRLSVCERLADAAFAKRVGAAIAARFREIIVDEAQDCNPADLAIVDWLRQCGIAVKVICDPNQSIYMFRGGVTDELLKFANTFAAQDRLTMTGNFRSTPAICAAITALQPPSARSNLNEPLGRHKGDSVPVHILSYGGTAVPSAIGSAFRQLTEELRIALHDAPVLASTRQSASKAIGQPAIDQTIHKTLLLADAAMSYHFSFATGNRRQALQDLHRIVLFIQERIDALGQYHSYLMSAEIQDGRWRPEIIALANALRFEPNETPDQWLKRARSLIAPGLNGARTINQRLQNHADLAKALARAPANSLQARTIHSAKGMEFPAVCVVMTTQKAGSILDSLEGQSSPDADEDARKIYVAASRAERLLAIAIPKSQATRLMALLASSDCQVELHQI